MFFEIISVLWRLAAVALAIGVVLHLLGTDANEVLARVNATPEQLGHWIELGWDMALPNLILGAVVLLPLWLITYVLRPPKK